MDTYTNIATVTRETTLNVIALGDGLNVFKLSTTHQRKTSTGTLKVAPEKKQDTSRQGFIDDANLEKLTKGRAYKTLGHLHILLAESREIMRTHGYVFYNDKALSAQFKKFVLDNVFDAIAEERAGVNDIVEYKNGCHMLFDRFGKPLPVAISFDYISHGRISEANYDLEKLAAHLLTRDDVVIYPCKGYSRDSVDTDKVAQNTQEAICAIPYYNSERGKSKTVYFKWIPSLEDYRTMWDECIKRGGEYPSTHMHHAIFDLDLLGLRACGAALHDSYWKDTERDEVEEDDY